MKKSDDNRGVPHPGNKIHIPLKTDEAISLIAQVKPTKAMPRPGASGKNKATKPRGRSKKQH